MNLPVIVLAVTFRDRSYISTLIVKCLHLTTSAHGSGVFLLFLQCIVLPQVSHDYKCLEHTAPCAVTQAHCTPERGL